MKRNKIIKKLVKKNLIELKNNLWLNLPTSESKTQTQSRYTCNMHIKHSQITDGHGRISMKNVAIMNKNFQHYYKKVPKAIFIRQMRPILNVQDTSALLKLFIIDSFYFTVRAYAAFIFPSRHLKELVLLSLITTLYHQMIKNRTIAAS